jgi:hypothetical protein
MCFVHTLHFVLLLFEHTNSLSFNISLSLNIWFYFFSLYYSTQYFGTIIFCFSSSALFPSTQFFFRLDWIEWKEVSTLNIRNVLVVLLTSSRKDGEIFFWSHSLSFSSHYIFLFVWKRNNKINLFLPEEKKRNKKVVWTRISFMIKKEENIL